MLTCRSPAVDLRQLSKYNEFPGSTTLLKVTFASTSIERLEFAGLFPAPAPAPASNKRSDLTAVTKPPALSLQEIATKRKQGVGLANLQCQPDQALALSNQCVLHPG